MNSENNLYPTVLFCVICTLFLPLFFQLWWLTEKLRTHWRVWRTMKWLMGAGRDIRLLEDSEASSPNVIQMNLLMCSRPHVLKIYFCSFIKRDQVEALLVPVFFSFSNLLPAVVSKRILLTTGTVLQVFNGDYICLSINKVRLWDAPTPLKTSSYEPRSGKRDVAAHSFPPAGWSSCSLPLFQGSSLSSGCW